MCTTCMMANCNWSSDKKCIKKPENSKKDKVGQNKFSWIYIYIYIYIFIYIYVR